MSTPKDLTDALTHWKQDEHKQTRPSSASPKKPQLPEIARRSDVFSAIIYVLILAVLLAQLALLLVFDL